MSKYWTLIKIIFWFILRRITIASIEVNYLIYGISSLGSIIRMLQPKVLFPSTINVSSLRKMEKKVERKQQNRASTYRKYWNKNRCNELTSGRALNPKKRKKKWLKENKPENGWKQCQYPQGTLDDPVIRKQTSTDRSSDMAGAPWIWLENRFIQLTSQVQILSNVGTKNWIRTLPTP